MALKKTMVISGTGSVQTEFGAIRLNNISANVTDCYIKVENVTFSKTSKCQALVSFTGDDTSWQSIYTFDGVISNKNAIQQAYEHLKTLDEFASAVDC